jgi:cobalt/nickel transport system permease protein
MLLHIHAPSFEFSPPQHCLWQRAIPETRVLVILGLVFAIALAPHQHWLTWSVYAIAGFVLLRLAKVSLPTLGQRLALEGVFVCTIALGAIFNPSGTAIWQWGWLQITDVGVGIFISVMAKSLLSLLLLNLLMLTTSVTDVLSALANLRVPALLIAIAASMYRYLSVLMSEFQVMQRAAAARNLTGRAYWQRLLVGNMIGALFIRTYERGDRIHQAMLARGYRGVSLSSGQPLHFARLDYAILAIVGSWILLGQLISVFRT